MTVIRKRLGEILVSGGLITEVQLQQALLKQRQAGLKLGEVLIQDGIVTEEQIVKTVQSQMGISLIRLDDVVIKPSTIQLLPEDVARKYNVIPVDLLNGQLLLSMENPTDYFALEDIRRIVGVPIRIAISMKGDLEKAINRYYGKSAAEKAAHEFVSSSDSTRQGTGFSLDAGLDEQVNAPVVKFINTVIENALMNQASDIHIEPEEQRLRVRFRIDGVLREILDAPVGMHNSLISRIKIMAELNIAERRVPQDGRISYPVGGRTIDLRVSTAPTVHGEKVVMRVLDRTSFTLTKETLGMTAADEIRFDRILARPHGMVLVTGPTGSGKTTTLYTMLARLNDVSKNIVTLEDPVEYHFAGINQMQVNLKAGFTFAAGLRSILRQDPDIIMVGEIRDQETADIAIRASLTGHLVLSTLHTNDAVSTINRLIDIGIEPFMLAATLNGIIAQRLVRKICPRCKQSYTASDRDRYFLNDASVTELFQGAGCEQCGHTGYQGRRAIMEMLEITAELQDLIDRRVSIQEYRSAAAQSGMKSLRDHCALLVKEGITSIDELIRVAYGD